MRCTQNADERQKSVSAEAVGTGSGVGGQVKHGVW